MLSKLEGSSWHPSVDGAAAFVTFTDEMYEAMLHDDARTSAFGLAISRRVRAHAGDCVVLDLGTGPFAVLALFAARAGASKVFAVEANPEAAAKARALIASSAASDIPPGTIEVIEGFSTTITLPEQADLLISEIAGSIASEEGMLATIRDARLRHLKRPWDPRSYIPARVQTLAVPAAYSLHHRLNCNWIASGPPVRFACDNPWLLPLATPQLWEDFAFGGEELPPGSGARCTTVLEFRVCASTLKANAARLLEQLDLHDVDADRAGVPKQGRSQNPARCAMPCAARPEQLADSSPSASDYTPMAADCDGLHVCFPHQVPKAAHSRSSPRTWRTLCPGSPAGHASCSMKAVVDQSTSPPSLPSSSNRAACAENPFVAIGKRCSRCCRRGQRRSRRVRSSQ
jgi:hypothetical protein